jgi:integrase
MSIFTNFLNLYNKDIIENPFDFNFENLSIESLITKNIPVSYDSDLNPISYWNDLKWDFSYTTDKRKKMFLDLKQYKNKLSKNLFEEFKYVLYSLYIDKSAYSTKTEAAVIGTSLITFFSLLNNEKINSITKLNNNILIIKLLENIKGVYSAGTLKAKLLHLRDYEKLNLPSLPVSFGFNQKKRVFLKNTLCLESLSQKYANQKKLDKEQTLYIPNKIHSEIVNNAINVINENYSLLNNISLFLEDDYLAFEEARIIAEKNDAQNLIKHKLKDKIKNIRKSPQNNILSINDLVKKHKLPKRLSNYTLIKDECRLIATSSFILILTFSGMRNDELLQIKNNGYKELNTEPALHIIRTFENKISGGQVVDYITSPIIKKVFKSLNKISDLSRKYGQDTNKDNLFLNEKSQKLLSYYDKSQMNKNLKWFVNKFDIKVDKESFKEHQLINGKLNNDIKIGENWKLSSHQFRRTLIVNFVSHNLSSINEVKQQVKHMYSTMTEYYANNSQLAAQMQLKPIDSMVAEIEKEKLEENVRQYKDFYYGNDTLSGVKGKKIIKERHIAEILSEEDIKLMFTTGAYKLTKSTYGYCTKGDMCDKSGIADPSFCGMSCETMIITRKNALEWEKLYKRNNKLLLNDSNLLCYNGVNLDGAITMMKNQNEVAKKILKEFGMEI